MEELRTAINAMKAAEIVLAARGYRLRWKVRVRADQGFVRRMVERLIESAEDPAPARETPPENKEAPSGLFQKTVRTKYRPAEKAQEQTAPEPPKEEAQPAEQKPEEAVEEARPVTALDINGAAAYLGMTLPGLYYRIKQGRIIAHGRLGDRWFLTGELDQYLESRRGRRRDKGQMA